MVILLRRVILCCQVVPYGAVIPHGGVIRAIAGGKRRLGRCGRSATEQAPAGDLMINL
jgi:hypothetical protein